MTLLFAGHDTTTSTVSFMFYELARNPHVAERLLAEQDALLAGRRAPSAAQLISAASCRELEMVLDETLRKYPPAWVGPRRAIETFEFDGHTIPARAFVNYCSWASHHLPDVFAEPEEFRPERFTPEAKAALPKGAYVPSAAARARASACASASSRCARSPRCILAALHALAARRLPAGDPPDADDQPQGRAAHARPHAPRAASAPPPLRAAA